MNGSISWRKVAKENITKYTESGLLLHDSRFKEGWTQQQLADRLGALSHHISEMEHDKRPISKKMAQNWARPSNRYRVFL